MTHDKLDQLLKVLNQRGVKKFKNKFIEVEFDESSSLVSYPSPVTHSSLGGGTEIPEPKQDDFKADELMSYDKILNWSTTQDHTDQSQMPLTGDKPL